jgi:hypothetical protein
MKHINLLHVQSVASIEGVVISMIKFVTLILTNVALAIIENRTLWNARNERSLIQSELTE